MLEHELKRIADSLERIEELLERHIGIHRLFEEEEERTEAELDDFVEEYDVDDMEEEDTVEEEEAQEVEEKQETPKGFERIEEETEQVDVIDVDEVTETHEESEESENTKPEEEPTPSSTEEASIPPSNETVLTQEHTPKEETEEERKQKLINEINNIIENKIPYISLKSILALYHIERLEDCSLETLTNILDSITELAGIRKENMS
jgi:chemotaxis protein histidine kinase CheA